MATILLVVHLLIALALVGAVLLQRSEGGGLGIGGGGGGGMGGFMTGRDTANLLTRATALVAALFFVTSMSLAWIAANKRAPSSIVDTPKTEAPVKPGTTPAPDKTPTPDKPSVPTK